MQHSQAAALVLEQTVDGGVFTGDDAIAIIEITSCGVGDHQPDKCTPSRSSDLRIVVDGVEHEAKSIASPTLSVPRCMRPFRAIFSKDHWFLHYGFAVANVGAQPLVHECGFLSFCV